MRWLVISTAAVLALNSGWAFAADATTEPAAEKSEKSNAIPAPPRQSGEGLGPYKKLVIRDDSLLPRNLSGWGTQTALGNRR